MAGAALIAKHGYAAIQITGPAKQIIDGFKYLPPVSYPADGDIPPRTIEGQKAVFEWHKVKPLVEKGKARFLYGQFITAAGFRAAENENPAKRIDKKNVAHIARVTDRELYERILLLMQDDVIEDGKVAIDHNTGKNKRLSFEAAALAAGFNVIDGRLEPVSADQKKK